MGEANVEDMDMEVIKVDVEKAIVESGEVVEEKVNAEDTEDVDKANVEDMDMEVIKVDMEVMKVNVKDTEVIKVDVEKADMEAGENLLQKSLLLWLNPWLHPRYLK